MLHLPPHNTQLSRKNTVVNSKLLLFRDSPQTPSWCPWRRKTMESITKNTFTGSTGWQLCLYPIPPSLTQCDSENGPEEAVWTSDTTPWIRKCCVFMPRCVSDICVPTARTCKWLRTAASPRGPAEAGWCPRRLWADTEAPSLPCLWITPAATTSSSSTPTTQAAVPIWAGQARSWCFGR